MSHLYLPLKLPLLGAASPARFFNTTHKLLRYLEALVGMSDGTSKALVISKIGPVTKVVMVSDSTKSFCSELIPVPSSYNALIIKVALHGF